MCVWKNSYDAENKCTQIEIAVTYEDGEKFVESFYEYAYSREQIEAFVMQQDLKLFPFATAKLFRRYMPIVSGFCLLL